MVRRGWLIAVTVALALVASSCTTWAWGLNSDAQLGLGDTSNRSAPALIDSLPQGDWIDVDAGLTHTCGVRDDATLWCWGDNGFGQLGDGTTTTRGTTNVAVAGAWDSVSAGGSHTCGVQTGVVKCWGANFSGQLGTGNTTDATVPKTVLATGSFTAVSAGDTDTCAIRSDRTLWCWGDNFAGQLGDGTTTRRKVPVQIGLATDWVAVATGGIHTCGIRATGLGTTGDVWCWGANPQGQLGDGTVTQRLQPTKVTTHLTWAELTAGAAHTCALTGSALWCWGSNASGQLGNGTTTNRTTPTRVDSPTTWNSVSAGRFHTCAIRSGISVPGSLWCWGFNGSGQLGDGTTTDRTTPTRVGTLKTWISVSAGGFHTCAIEGLLAASCWGSNGAGQLGDGTNTDRTAPVPIGAGGFWVEISAGGSHTAGIVL